MKSELILLVLSMYTLEASGEQLTYAIPLSIVQSRAREISYCLKEVWTSAEYTDCRFPVKFPGHDLHFKHGGRNGLRVRGMVTLKRLEPLVKPKNVLISSVNLLFTKDNVPIIQEMRPSSRFLFKASSVFNEPFYQEKELSREAIIRDCLRNTKKCVITHVVKRTLSKQPSVRKIFNLDYIPESEARGLLSKAANDKKPVKQLRVPFAKVQINYPAGREMLTGYIHLYPSHYKPGVETPVVFPQTFTVWNPRKTHLDQEGTQLILQDPEIRHGLKFHKVPSGKWIPSNAADEGIGFIEFPFCSKGEPRPGKYISEMNTIQVTEHELLDILDEAKPSCVQNRVGVARFSEKVQLYLHCENAIPRNASKSLNNLSYEYNINGDIYVEGELLTRAKLRSGKTSMFFYNTPKGIEKTLGSVDGFPVSILVHESQEGKLPESAIVEKKVEYVDLFRLKQFLRENYDYMKKHFCDYSTEYVMTRYGDISVYLDCAKPFREMFIAGLKGVRAVNDFGESVPKSLRYSLIHYDFDRDLYMTINDIIVGLYAFVKKTDYFKYDFEDKEVRIHMDEMLPFLRETSFDDLNGGSPKNLAAIRLGDKYVLAVDMVPTKNLFEASTSSKLPTFKIKGKLRKLRSTDSTEDKLEAKEVLISEDTYQDVNHQYIDNKALSIGIPSKLVLTQGEEDSIVSLSYFARMNVMEAIIKNIKGKIHKEYCGKDFDDLLNVDIEMEEHYYIRGNYHCTHKQYKVAIKSWGFSKHSFTKYHVVVIFARGKMYIRYMLEQMPNDIYAFHIKKDDGYVPTGKPKKVCLDNGECYRYFVRM